MINPKQQTRLRILRSAPASKDVQVQHKWKMEYLGNQTRVPAAQNPTVDQDLLQKVVTRPILPSYVNPSPFSILPVLGFKFVVHRGNHKIY